MFVRFNLFWVNPNACTVLANRNKLVPQSHSFDFNMEPFEDPMLLEV